MIKKLREIIIDDFEFSEISQIGGHIKKLKDKRKKLDNISETLAFIQKRGVNGVVFVDEENCSVRLPGKEFSK